MEIFLRGPVPLLQRGIQGFTISLGTGVVCPTRDLPCDDGPFGRMDCIQGQQKLVFFPSPSGLLHGGAQRVKPSLFEWNVLSFVDVGELAYW